MCDKSVRMIILSCFVHIHCQAQPRLGSATQFLLHFEIGKGHLNVAIQGNVC